MEQKPCSFIFKNHYLRSWKGIQNVSISLRTNGHETAIIAIFQSIRSKYIATWTKPAEAFWNTKQGTFFVLLSDHS